MEPTPDTPPERPAVPKKGKRQAHQQPSKMGGRQSRLANKGRGLLIEEGLRIYTQQLLPTSTSAHTTMVYEVKDLADFNQKLEEAGNNLVIVDFHATWCGPCKMIAPKIEEMSKDYTNVVFLKVDVDECEDIATQYDISAMPTFVFIKNKQKVEAFSGANADKLKELLLKFK
ncbi:Thioredoxin [Gryllus bimaculatus]|nr:Thioredoxin [Gryllus bimaculatus]